MSRILRFHAAAVLGNISMAALLAQPIDRAELEALRAQVHQLEAQVKVLSQQRLETAEPARARPEPPAAAAPVEISVTDRGYGVASADAANSLRVRSLLQFDSRSFFNDGGIANDTFILRRARLIAEGKLARDYGYRFATEFGGSTVTMLDANLTASLAPAVQFKAGKFKTPVGHEILQSIAAVGFTERSLASGLLPGRDLGVQLSGDMLDGRLTYMVGVFNGIPDGTTSNNSDFDEHKDAAARLIARPFAGVSSPLQGLAFGVGASRGQHNTAAGRASAYRTDGQQTFFSYAPAVVADGAAWRIAPNLDYRLGPLGVIGEYVVSAANLRPDAAGPRTELRHHGWQLAAAYVLTGENSSYTGVVPRENFSLAAGTWGAFEVLGRVSAVDMDDASFPRFAAANTNATDARALAIGLNWHLSKAVRFMFDYYQTAFGLSAPAAAALLLRQDEKVFLSRFQLAF